MRFQEGDHVRIVGVHLCSGDPYIDEAVAGSVGVIVAEVDLEESGTADVWEVDWISHPDDFNSTVDSSWADGSCLESVILVNGKAVAPEVTAAELDEVYALLGMPMQEPLF